MAQIKKITKNTMIGEAIKINERAEEIFAESGMHCFGCMGMFYETIAQGFKAHGFTDKQIDEIVEKLNSKSIKNAKKQKKYEIKHK